MAADAKGKDKHKDPDKNLGKVKKPKKVKAAPAAEAAPAAAPAAPAAPAPTTDAPKN